MGNCADAPSAASENKALPRGKTAGDVDANRMHEAKANVQYALLVFVCQGKNIKASDLLGKSDCYVKVSVDNHEKRTAVRNNSRNPVWNQMLALSGLDKKPDKVVIKAMDQDSLSRDDTLGSATVALSPKDWDQKDSPWRWVDITNKKGEKTGELQLRIEAVTVDQKKESELAHFDYTHLLEVTILSGKELHRGGLDPHAYCTVQWGPSTFRTKAAHGGEPAWNQKVFFWANGATQHGYSVAVRVFDDDNLSADDPLGQVQIPLEQKIFEQNADYEVEKWYPMSMLKLKDKDLGSRDSRAAGQLKMRVKLMRREQVEDRFWHRLLDEFDANNDRQLDKDEVQAMLVALGIDISTARFDFFWDTCDRNGDGLIDNEEAIVFLRSLVMSETPSVASRLLLFIGEGVQAVEAALMQNVPSHHSDSEIPVIDRKTGLLVQENIPTYIKVALTSLFSSHLSRAVTKVKQARNLMTSLSIKRGLHADSPESVGEIADFIKLHNLDVDEILEPLMNFKTFNQFFYRELKPTARPIASPNDPTVAVSPADCRLMVFPDIKEATDLWIKGDKFTVENVFGPCEALASKFKTGSLLIARLAPQDYHRWHVPCNGTFGPHVPIDGDLYTVNPIAVNKNVNVFTMNKRVVCPLESPEFGTVGMIAVGATMVGSINFLRHEGDKVKKGDQHGYFAFGGSTVLVFFEKGRIEFDADLITNSRKKIETLIKVNQSIGRLPHPEKWAQAQAATQAERATFLAAVDLNRKTQTELPPVESATVSSDKLRED